MEFHVKEFTQGTVNALDASQVRTANFLDLTEYRVTNHDKQLPIQKRQLGVGRSDSFDFLVLSEIFRIRGEEKPNSPRNSFLVGNGTIDLITLYTCQNNGVQKY